MLNGAMVPFDLDGGVALVVMRALWVASLMLTFGSVLFTVWVAPHALARMPAEAGRAVAAGLGRLIAWALGATLLAGCGWLLLETGALAETGQPAAILAALPTVLGETQFGRLLGLQIGLLACTGLCRARRLALLPATLAMLLQCGHGHAASMQSAPFLLLASGVHLLAAGAWLGGLPPLLFVVRVAPARAAASAARYFSPLGKLCIAAILCSAAVQAWVLLGSIPALFGTAYGWMLLVKLVLFAVLLGFAAINRYRLAPALLHADAATARRHLSASIALQSAAAIAILLAAAVLASLPPGTHVQPVWPFRWQFSLDALREAPEFRSEVGWAALAVMASLLLLIAAIRYRRRRQVALCGIAAAAALAWIGLGHLDLLLVSAYPTSFQTSPTGFTVNSIARGAALYPAHCAACHGLAGRGDGPEAASLAVPPADLTAWHLWAHSDGALFWWLSHGIDGPNGGLSMPGFAGQLSENDRWDLIDAIRARNAGLAERTTGRWSPPITAPELQADCPDGRSITLADERGHVVVLRFVRTEAGHLRTIISPVSDGARIACASDDDAAALAYAIVSGQNPGQTTQTLAGAKILVDAAGWLRAIEPSGVPPVELAAAIRRITAHPLALQPRAHHLHHGA